VRSRNERDSSFHHQKKQNQHFFYWKNITEFLFSGFLLLL